MKRFFSIFFIAVVIMAIIRCHPAEEIIPKVQHAEISEEELQKIRNVGFDVSKESVKVSDEGYIIEKDMLLGFEAIKEDKGTNERHIIASPIVSCSNVQDISVYFEEDVPLNIRNAAQAGYERWNNVADANVNFKTVNSSLGTDITISMDSSIFAVALARLPSSGGVPGSSITYDPKATIDGIPLSDAQWSIAFSHEFGHTIGFLHSDDENRSGAVIIIDEPDDLTVMQKFPIRPEVQGLSTNDKNALKLLYGENNPLCR